MLETKQEKLNREVGSNIDSINKKITIISDAIEASNKRLDTLETDAPEHFKKTIGARNKVSEIRNKAEDKLSKVESAYAKIEQGKDLVLAIVTELEANQSSIKQIQEQVGRVLDEILSNKEEYIVSRNAIESMIDELRELTEEHSSLSVKINELSKQVELSENQSNTLKQLVINAKKEREDVRNLHGEIFGYVFEDDDGEEVVVEGLKASLDKGYSELKENIARFSSELDSVVDTHQDKVKEIEELYSGRLNDFISKSESQRNAILEQIKSLLPDALTAGLSGAYVDKISQEKKQLEKHEKSFNLSIVGLISLSLIPVLFSMYRVLSLGESFTIVITDAPSLFSIMLPVYAPILWVAYSSNKSYKLSKRLIEEYNHKEVSSRTFEGLSNQISQIGENDTNNELRTKLLFNLLQVNSENPGKLISDYNKTDHPILDAIDKSSKFSDALNRLDNIPILTPLLKHLDAKERSKLEKSASDVQRTLDIESDGESSEK